MELRNKLFWYGVIPSVFFAIYLLFLNFCFAGEKEELQIKEAYYQKSIQCAQYEIALAQNELKLVQKRLREIAIEETKKPEIKKEEIKK